MGQDHGAGADQDDYEPRRHDALIEPLFGGLQSPEAGRAQAQRVDAPTPTSGAQPAPPSARAAWAARSLGLFAALLALAAVLWLVRACAP